MEAEHRGFAAAEPPTASGSARHVVFSSIRERNLIRMPQGSKKVPIYERQEPLKVTRAARCQLRAVSLPPFAHVNASAHPVSTAWLSTSCTSCSRPPQVYCTRKDIHQGCDEQRNCAEARASTPGRARIGLNAKSKLKSKLKNHMLVSRSRVHYAVSHS